MGYTAVLVYVHGLASVYGYLGRAKRGERVFVAIREVYRGERNGNEGDEEPGRTRRRDGGAVGI